MDADSRGLESELGSCFAKSHLSKMLLAVEVNPNLRAGRIPASRISHGQRPSVNCWELVVHVGLFQTGFGWSSRIDA